VVFGAQKGQVAVYAGAPTEEQFPKAFPCCLIVLGDGDPDEDHPTLITHTFRLVTGVLATGDSLGEHALIGGPSSDLGKSANRGIAEVTERVRSAVGELTGADGAKIQLTATAIDTPFLVGALRHVVFDEHTMTALCTSGLHYAAPQHVKRVGSAWTWEGGDLNGAGHCSGRFDFLQYRLVEKAGFTPSTSPSDGTVRATVTTAAATFAPTFANTYTVFADYSSRGQTGVVEGSSDPVVGSYRVVL